MADAVRARGLPEERLERLKIDQRSGGVPLLTRDPREEGIDDGEVEQETKAPAFSRRFYRRMNPRVSGATNL